MKMLLIISSLIGLSISRPADECDDQLGCLEVSRDALQGGDKYRVCLTFNSGLYGCHKDGTISHVCPSREESEKIEGFGSGDSMCKTVDCGSVAEFGLKDGRGCRRTKELLGQTISGIDGISCDFDPYQGYCGGGNNEACVWTIPTPDCEESEEPVCDDPNKEYNECGTACPAKCGDTEPVFCILPCIAECQCKPGLVLDDYGNCIDPSYCPRPDTPAPVTPAPVTPAPVTPAPVEPECGGLLTYGATYLGDLYDAVCNPDAYTDPCAQAYIGGVFKKNYLCCYCEPAPDTPAPVTPAPVTPAPTTANPTTADPTTANPTTAVPTTANPTTAEPTTANPTTAEPTTAEPTIPDCDENEVYNPCGSPCDSTCESPDPICIQPCEPRCECIDGYVYNADGQCIPLLGCPQPVSCASTTCEQGVDCCYNEDGSGGCGFSDDNNGGCTEQVIPEPECGGQLPYGATYLGGLYEAVCNPDPYAADPCAYYPGDFAQNYLCCYCSPPSYAQSNMLNIKDIGGENGDKFTQTQFLLLNSLVSVLSALFVMGICLTGYCVYTKCKSNKSIKYEFVDEEKV